MGTGRVILFIPRTVSKHKIQLLPSKVCAIFYLLKDKVATPNSLKKFSQNIIKIFLKNGNFFYFWRMGRGWVIVFIPRTVSKHKIQLLPIQVCAILYLSKDRVAIPHTRMSLNSKLPN